nr:ATP-dependent DNA helicase PIF1-like [Tanacetum cinerariifolium]
MSAFLDMKTGQGVDPTIVAGLMDMLDQKNAVAQSFRMARDWCHSHESVNFELHLLSDRTSARQYNAPTVSEVAALITNNFRDDTFTAVEERRLKWTRNNQDSLRVDLYHNLNDAFTRGNTNAEGLGKRIVLPKTFTGGPRYMMQNYQDAMDLCRAYGNPDLFITFTSNPKWPEIAEMLSFIPGQKPYERPKVGTHVFKMKFTQLLEDLIKYKIFWKSCAGIPSDPDRHFKTNEGCPTLIFCSGSKKNGSAKHQARSWCTVDGKCSKKYLKPFYPETNLDEDGYPVYCRRDSKIHAVKGKFTYDNKGPQGFKELMTVNKKFYLTFKAECFTYGLLNDNKEWAHAINEASFWALAPQLRDLFVTMIIFCDVSRPLRLWEETWELLSQDIFLKKRKLYKYPKLQLKEEQIKNYCLVKIEALLKRNRRSLMDFQELPWPNPELLTKLDNRLIRKAMYFDIKESKLEHDRLHSLLNPEQHAIYEAVIQSIYNQSGQLYFIYGLGGTGKTFVYKTIISRIRSEGMIVFAWLPQESLRCYYPAAEPHIAGFVQRDPADHHRSRTVYASGTNPYWLKRRADRPNTPDHPHIHINSMAFHNETTTIPGKTMLRDDNKQKSGAIT